MIVKFAGKVVTILLARAKVNSAYSRDVLDAHEVELVKESEHKAS